MNLELVYTSKMNYVIDGMISKYISELVSTDMDCTLDENYELLNIKSVGDEFIVAFGSQLENKTTKKMNDGISIYVVPEEFDTEDLIWDACSDNEYLFCVGLEK